MKKSKVIIPAMALLLFSTAASITGTVAWFTATRVVSISAGQFVVNNIDDGLDAEVVGGVGTTASADKKSAVVDADTKLTHGSVNINDKTDKKAWILNRNASGPSDYRESKDTLANAESGYATPRTAADKWYVKDNTEGGTVYHYYVAFSWTINFTYTFNHTGTNVGVYLNPKESTLEFSKADSGDSGTYTLKTGLGFRIAFFGNESKTKVFGNNPGLFDTDNNPATDPVFDETKLFFATGAHETTNRDHYDGNYIRNLGSSDDYTVVQDVVGTDDAAASANNANIARPERVCTIAKPAGDVKSATVAVKCVAWFEGEDPNVVSTAEMDLVNAKLSFYARNDKAA